MLERKNFQSCLLWSNLKYTFKVNTNSNVKCFCKTSFCKPVKCQKRGFHHTHPHEPHSRKYSNCIPLLWQSFSPCTQRTWNLFFLYLFHPIDSKLFFLWYWNTSKEPNFLLSATVLTFIILTIDAMQNGFFVFFFSKLFFMSLLLFIFSLEFFNFFFLFRIHFLFRVFCFST